MKKLAVLSMCLGGVFAAGTSHAIDLKQSKITQVVNDVRIISAAEQRQKAAAVNDVFAMPDVLRTGAASRAELVAPDETVTRVGANTVFSFDPANRTLDLQQGSLLFHAPHGKGGGTIHTGSATASVLGTTLIVTTTPNGGFKVIDLEGKVEMKLSSGRKQKLDPGQMTFILPGTNQLAPVIIFRIDELIRNSLLIKGFSETLESLPLIQNQSDHQATLVRLGKLADTGLYAGDNANPNQVEVLDVNTVSHGQQVNPQPQSQPQPAPIVTPPPPPNPAAAEAADATINQPSLTDASIPTPPVHVFTGISLIIPGEFDFANQGFSGFVANNIFMNTLGAASDANPLIVNLSPYASRTTFDFVAVNDFSIAGSVTFQGLRTEDNLDMLAGNQFILQPGISVSANVQTFLFSSPASLSLDHVSLSNQGQNLNLTSSGDVSLQDNSLVKAGGQLNFSVGGNLSVAGSELFGEGAEFTAVSGNMTFDSATLDFKNSSLFIALGGSIALDNATLDANSSSSFLASTAINLNNSTINSGSVNLGGIGSTSISINNTTINASSSLSVASVGELDITGNPASPGVRPDTISDGGSALNADPTTGSVSLSSSSGSVNVSGTSITAHFLTLNSGDGILLDASGQTLTASGSGATANFTAPNTITVNNANISSFAVVNMAANTIVLVNDMLGIINNFGTATGLANVSGSSSANAIPGELNLFDCTWQGNPVTSSSITYSSGPLNTPGINSYKR